MRRFWIWFHNKYGDETSSSLSVPMGYLSDFSAHYLLHDKEGNVKDKAKNIFEAIRKHNTTGLYVARIHESR